jgi:nitrogen regulatory protein P-II 1
MKLIKVIMRPERTLVLKDVLSSKGFHGITAKPSIGFGEQKKKIKQVFRGKVYMKRAESVKREEIEFIVPDYRVESVIKTIRSVATTGYGGDGRIYVWNVEDSIHIEKGDRHMGDVNETGIFDA